MRLNLLGGLSLALVTLSMSGFTGCDDADKNAKKAKASPTATAAAPTNQTALPPLESAKRISVADAAAEFRAGTAFFVDTRGEGEFDVDHVKGAINLPANIIAQNLAKLPKDKKIITYCT